MALSKISSRNHTSTNVTLETPDQVLCVVSLLMYKLVHFLPSIKVIDIMMYFSPRNSDTIILCEVSFKYSFMLLYIVYTINNVIRESPTIEYEMRAYYKLN